MKKQMNSQKVYQGPERIEARSLLYATGKLEKDIGRKPLIGVVSSFNEIVPGHFNFSQKFHLNYFTFCLPYVIITKA